LKLPRSDRAGPTAPPAGWRTQAQRLWREHGGLLLALAIGLALRLLLWGRIPRTGLISDEGEYFSAADWLAHGRGFNWYLGYLWTRAPLYPLLVAAHFRLFGDTPAPIYLTQTLLSLLNVALVYALARHVMSRAGQSTDFADYTDSVKSHRIVPTVAAILMAVYLPFALYAQVLLSETLFIALLLGGFMALARWAEGRKTKDGAARTFRWSIALAGVLFGLATLTRSLTLPFIPVVALWLLMQEPRTKNREPMVVSVRRFSVLGSRFWPAAVFLTTTTLVIAPWTIYNSRMYGGLVVVDTSGAFNILLGGRTAYDGRRDDAATRDFALALLDPQLKPADRARMLGDQRDASGALTRAGACLLRRGDPALRAAIERGANISQAERQQLMTREGLCLIGERPLAFAQKSLGELIDLFQINYGGDERFADGFAIGRLPRWYALALFLLDDTLYVLALPLAVIGWALVRKLRIENEELRKASSKAPHSQFSIFNPQFSTLIGLWWLYNLAVAPLLFAINRFRLPLLPFAFIFAAYALARLPGGWGALRSRYGGLCAALAGLLLLIAATPYAYLEPRAPGADSRWASYLGPYPSSLADTLMAWRARPGYLREQQVMHALGTGDATAARELLGQADVTSHTLALARPLLAGLDGQPAAGLDLLAQQAGALSPLEAALVRADLLRSAGDRAAARAIFTQQLIDNNNPVEWAWGWLHPARLLEGRIDIAGNLDLGYLSGCYLGEGDASVKPPANFRWCSDGARLRFPGAGTGAPQALTLLADGRGWAGYAAAPPPVRVFVGGTLAGTFTPDLQAPRAFTVTLPPSAPGADVVVTLRTDTFVPDAGRYLRQQGKAVVGQVQRLGVRLDWTELRP
jgi:hypothetical protein